MTIKTVGVAGIGAIGKTVCDALIKGIAGYELRAISDIEEKPEFNVPNLNFLDLCQSCDLIIEALPPHQVSDLARQASNTNKDIIIISSCALLMHPEIIEWNKSSTGRIIVPSGALIGLDGVNALKNIGIQSAKIVSTKPPLGFSTAPYVEKNDIKLKSITSKTKIFEGNALDASKGFPANVNVAATLSLAGIGPEKTKVEIWADPDIKRNTHEIIVESQYSKITARVENEPTPSNPKTSVLAAQSIIAVLQGFTEPFVVL